MRPLFSKARNTGQRNHSGHASCCRGSTPLCTAMYDQGMREAPIMTHALQLAALLGATAAIAGAVQRMQALRRPARCHGSCREGFAALHLQRAARGLRLAAGVRNCR